MINNFAIAMEHNTSTCIRRQNCPDVIPVQLHRLLSRPSIIFVMLAILYNHNQGSIYRWLANVIFKPISTQLNWNFMHVAPSTVTLCKLVVKSIAFR